MDSQFDGYTYEGLTRKNRRGGGLAMYVKRQIQYDVEREYSVMNENVECLVIRIKCGYFCVMYRPPCGSKGHFLNFVEDLLNNLSNTGSMFVIMGDVNINMLGNDVSAREFNNIIKSYACGNLVNLPTRLTAESATLLDVCITNVSCLSASVGL